MEVSNQSKKIEGFYGSPPHTEVFDIYKSVNSVYANENNPDAGRPYLSKKVIPTGISNESNFDKQIKKLGPNKP